MLTINILSTWGDRHYVGLTGLELFGGHGGAVQLNARTQVRGWTSGRRQE